MKSIAALGAAAVMPMGAVFSSSATATVATVSTSVPANLYTWSAMIARTKGTCSPEILMSSLNIEASRANFLFKRLVTNNVVSATGSTIATQSKVIIEQSSSQHRILSHIDGAEPDENLEEGEDVILEADEIATS